jgi:hypothetical protein
MDFDRIDQTAVSKIPNSKRGSRRRRRQRVEREEDVKSDVFHLSSFIFVFLLS